MGNFKKAVTFSFDDGVTQDIRFIDLLNKYNLKCTFNLNSELLGKNGELIRDNVKVSHNKVNASDVKCIYNGHEVAVHTLTHPILTGVEDENEIIRQVNQDRINLSELVGYDVIGMAYPGGGVNCDDRVADIIRKNCKEIRYARSIINSYNFDLQDDMIIFKPTVKAVDFDNLFTLGEKFINLKTDKHRIFYIWGHTYEFDIHNTWDKIEEFFKFISNRSDIFYGTNREVLLNL